MTTTAVITGASEPATARGRVTRERLLAAAAVVFARHGYEHARIADIVAEAGVSHGLFYRHFSDKNAVLLAVLTRFNDRLRHTSGRGGTGAATPTLADLQTRNILFFREYAEHRELFRVAREAAARTDENGFRDLWLIMRGRFIARTRRWLDRLAADGHIAAETDAWALAEALGAMTEQLAYVQVGLAADDLDDAGLERLGRACGLVWHRAVFGR